MGAAALNQPGSSPVSAARGSERATRTEAGHARGAAAGGAGVRGGRAGDAVPRAAGEGRGTTHPSMAHGADPRGTERRRRNSKDRPNGSEL